MNFSNPKVTIGMPAYNHGEFVEEAILSIINQTYQDFELIVIDDGSTDSTAEILESLSEKYGFSFERQDNMGLTKTMNKLFSNAKGEYFSCCASDDFYAPTRLERLVCELDSNPSVGLVHSNAYIVDQNSQNLGLMNGSNIYPENWGLRQLAARNTIIALTVMVRGHLMRQIGGYDEEIQVEDLLTWHKLIQITEFKYVHEPLAYYRKHASNTVKNKLLIYQNQKYVVDKYKHLPEYQEAMPEVHLRWFYMLSRSHKLEALRYFLPSLRHITNALLYRAIFRLLCSWRTTY